MIGIDKINNMTVVLIILAVLYFGYNIFQCGMWREHCINNLKCTETIYEYLLLFFFAVPINIYAHFSSK